MRTANVEAVYEDYDNSSENMDCTAADGFDEFSCSADEQEHWSDVDLDELANDFNETDLKNDDVSLEKVVKTLDSEDSSDDY